MGKLKKKIATVVQGTVAYDILQKFNLIIFHWNERMHSEHMGNNDNGKKYFIIRPLAKSQGLLSSFLYVVKNVQWAIGQGYEVYVDFQTPLCQYYTGDNIKGTENAWEYYFEQLTSDDRDLVFSQRKVLISGWSSRKNNKIEHGLREFEYYTDPKFKEFVNSKIHIRKYICDIVDTKFKNMFNGKILGVFIRGTDYIRFKPKGHPIQPSIEQVIEKIDEYLGLYAINKIFVVTEDYSYYQMLKKKYGDKIFSSDDYFIKNYDGKDYIHSSFDNSPYERGLNYLVRILLIGKCDYFIGGITNGSLVAKILQQGSFEDEYWFRLGNY